ncbi:isocitrate lyase/PEP mutase family protein [Candidatus Microgenomates bacterium]|nr:isocitrate lyase/PEP mutase family protein [Candidatus Microgenomates bacterium]
MNKIFKLLSKPGVIITPVVHDAITAKIAEKVGFEAVWVGGFGVAGATYGLPDVGLIGLSELLTATKNIINATNLPVLVDMDGGYGNERNVVHTVGQLKSIGVIGGFLEDQKHPKRCGHMNGKELISVEEMVLKIRAAKTISNFFLCARTDAIAAENFDKAIERANAYICAGADMIFIEAPENLDQLKRIPELITRVPLLINMLEGGKTPICTKKELETYGYKMIAYPVTTLFSASYAIENVWGF